MNVVDVDATEKVLAEVAAERHRQDAKWGQQNHPDLSSDSDLGLAVRTYAAEADDWKDVNAERVYADALSWDGILLEEVFEALAESNPAKLRAELVQVAAVAAAWIEAIDRRVS